MSILPPVYFAAAKGLVERKQIQVNDKPTT